MKHLVLSLFAAGLLTFATGCGDELSDEELKQSEQQMQQEEEEMQEMLPAKID